MKSYMHCLDTQAMSLFSKINSSWLIQRCTRRTTKAWWMSLWTSSQLRKLSSLTRLSVWEHSSGCWKNSWIDTVDWAARWLFIWHMVLTKRRRRVRKDRMHLLQTKRKKMKMRSKSSSAAFTSRPSAPESMRCSQYTESTSWLSSKSIWKIELSQYFRSSRNSEYISKCSQLCSTLCLKSRSRAKEEEKSWMRCTRGAPVEIPLSKICSRRSCFVAIRYSITSWTHG